MFRFFIFALIIAFCIAGFVVYAYPWLKRQWKTYQRDVEDRNKEVDEDFEEEKDTYY